MCTNVKTKEELTVYLISSNFLSVFQALFRMFYDFFSIESALWCVKCS